jgi:hypothetical protein
MRVLALMLLVACRGSNSAPATGSGSGSSPSREAAQTRAVACAPPVAEVTLAVHEDHPLACWDETCVRDGAHQAKAPRPSAWIRPAEVRMERGVLSACDDGLAAGRRGCRPLQTRLAEKIARTNASKVSVTTDLQIVIVDHEVWRADRGQPMLLVGPTEAFRIERVPQSRAVVAGRFFLATIEKHGQLYDSIGARIGTELLAWDPGEVVQLDDSTFLITDQSAPRFGVFDVWSGRMHWDYDQLAGFSITDAVRLRDGAGAVLLHDDAGWWIATFSPEARKIIAIEHVPLCRS